MIVGSGREKNFSLRSALPFRPLRQRSFPLHRRPMNFGPGPLLPGKTHRYRCSAPSLHDRDRERAPGVAEIIEGTGTPEEKRTATPLPILQHAGSANISMFRRRLSRRASPSDCPRLFSPPLRRAGVPQFSPTHKAVLTRGTSPPHARRPRFSAFESAPFLPFSAKNLRKVRIFLLPNAAPSYTTSLVVPR